MESGGLRGDRTQGAVETMEESKEWGGSDRDSW